MKIDSMEQAAAVWFGEYADVYESFLPDPEETNPENLLIRKQAFESLSGEAQTLLRMVANAPTELLGLKIFSTYGKKMLLSDTLFRRGQTKNRFFTKKIRPLVKEIRKYYEYLCS